MSIGEMFKKAFLSGYATSEITMEIVLFCLLCTTVIAVFVYWVYRVINKNSFYNKAFHLSLIVLAVITSAIILTIQSNIVVSLGMVGALSIVRFRTAIKDPMDLVFLFWSISVGIICGAGFALIAAAASLVIALIIAIVMASAVRNGSLVLVINATSFENEKEILQLVSECCQCAKIKARNASKESLNLAVEVRIKDEYALISRLLEMDCVLNASLVEHDGNITA